MKFVALKDLPQGQRPGDVFETTEAMGDVLVLVGAARAADAAASSDADVTERPRRRYTRRDITAEA